MGTMTRYALWLPLLALAAAFVITLRPGDTVTISGCTTRLELAGNVVRCVTRSATTSRTPSTAPTATATLTPTATSAATRTSAATASLTATQSATAEPTATASSTPSGTAVPSGALVGLAIIGDSAQDEYAAPENARPAINWVEHLALSGLPLGQWGSWGGARRTGYEFNWARSGATSAQALADQVPGVLAQLQAGTVTHVLVQVGNNDLHAALASSIYAGQPTDYGALDYIASNIAQSANTLASVAPGRVIVASVQDFVELDLLPDPERGVLNDPVGLQRVVDAVAWLNARTRSYLSPNVIWFDWNAAMASRLAQVRTGDTLTLAGQAVAIRARCGSVECGYVIDAYLHPGTAISGLQAQIYLDEMRSVWGLTLPTLTDAEIMARTP